MTSVGVIIVLVLLAIALWQLTKIFDLTQVGQGANSTQVADDKDNNVQGYVMFAFLAFLYIFTIYGLFAWGHLVLDNPASEHGKDVDRLMNITWVLIFTVQAITQVLLHYFAFKYRGNKDKKALYFADNDRLEFIWSVIPAVVLAVNLHLMIAVSAKPKPKWPPRIPMPTFLNSSSAYSLPVSK